MPDTWNPQVYFGNPAPENSNVAVLHIFASEVILLSVHLACLVLVLTMCLAPSILLAKLAPRYLVLFATR